MRRIPLTVAASLAWLVALAPPAAAHSVSGVGATNWRTRLVDVRPFVPGLRVRVVELGSRMELTNATGRHVVVLGYQGEPYLRVGPDGVFENTRSPATYLNRTRSGADRVPGTADPSAPPQWRKVSAGTTVRWHDHRIHWMGTSPPPQVRREPFRHHVVVPRWEVELRLVDGRRVVASGTLEWVPGPSPWPWVGLATALGLAVAAALHTRRWRQASVATLVALIAVDATHLVGVVGATAGSATQKLGSAVGSGIYSLAAWAAAGTAIRLLRLGRTDGLYPAAFAGFVVALAGGLADAGDLYRSQVPFAWGAVVARFLVAASLGLGSGLLVGSLLGLRRLAGRATSPAGEVPSRVGT